MEHKFVANEISSWIVNYTKSAGANTLVLGLSGGIDSALCALLIRRTNIPLVCINIPCNSSSSAYARAKDFAENELNTTLFYINLEDSFNSIIKQLPVNTGFDFNSNGSLGALRSCLRAPTLSFFAHSTNGLIVGTGNRSEDRITRYYQKFGDGCVDFSPIADLWKSEVYSLFKFLAEEKTVEMSISARAIYEAKPTADLWGPDSGQEDEKELGISYDEIEWVDKEDVKNGIIFSDDTPSLNKDWSHYTPRQQEIVTILHKLEKVSRHKHNPNLPVCKIH